MRVCVKGREGARAREKPWARADVKSIPIRKLISELQYEFQHFHVEPGRNPIRFDAKLTRQFEISLHDRRHQTEANLYIYFVIRKK